MKHVFIAPKEGDDLCVMYIDFAIDHNLGFILLPGAVRRIAKAGTMIGFDHFELSSVLLKKHFDCYIKREIYKKKWDDAICFILYGRIYESYGSSIIRYLRKNYQNCKIVVYLGDLVSRHKISLEKMKKEIDAVFSFDKGDAKKHRLIWCLEPFSAEILKSEVFINQETKWDVTYVGTDKGRYDSIIRLYEKLRDFGFRCDFHIIGVEHKLGCYSNEIGAVPLSFMELLQHVNSSKCILEIVQAGEQSPTTRFSEAMLFGKYLLTNCDYFRDKNNRPPNVIYLKNIEEIDSIDLQIIMEISHYDKEKYIEMFSIKNMVKTIDVALEIQ